MLSKLRYVGLVFFLLLVYSPLVAQNYNQRSYQDLQRELTNLSHMVNNKDWWFYLGNNGSPVGSHRDDVINLIIQAKITWDNPYYSLDERIRLIRVYTHGIKKDLRNTTIPELQKQIINHPDNPDNQYNPTPTPATTCHSRGKGVFWVGTGSLRYQCSYYGSGQLRSEVPYVNKKKHGTSIAYYQNGNPQSKTDYWNGKMTKQRWFKETGKMYSCKNYNGNTYLGSCLKTGEISPKSCCPGHKITCTYMSGAKYTYPDHSLIKNDKKRCHICGKSIECNGGIRQGDLQPAKGTTCQ